MIWELFLIGSFWFWAIIAVESFWLIRCLYEESGPGIGGSLISLSLILWLFGDFNVFAWIWHNPVFLVECVAAYLVVGTIWSLIRWKLLCTDACDLLQDAKREFLVEYKINSETVPKELGSKWGEYLGRQDWRSIGIKSYGAITGIEDIIPTPRDYKATILYWLGYWPLSMLWFFFHDMIERIFNRIYQTFSKLYQSIAKGTFAGIPNDFGDE